MRRRRARMQSGAIDRIDMTPLIDLTFLLLIVFMITMPLLEYGTSVEAPQMNADPLPDEKVETISVDRDGHYHYGKSVMTPEELRQQLRALMASEPQTVLLLRGDKNRPYDDIVKLMKLIRESGFRNVSLVTGAEDE